MVYQHCSRQPLILTMMASMGPFARHGGAFPLPLLLPFPLPSALLHPACYTRNGLCGTISPELEHAASLCSLSALLGCALIYSAPLPIFNTASCLSSWPWWPPRLGLVPQQLLQQQAAYKEHAPLAWSESNGRTHIRLAGKYLNWAGGSGK